MTTPAEPTRRFTLALTAAVAATTVALGVTAATLLGWFRPAETPRSAAIPTETAVAPQNPDVVYVPIAPIEPPAATPAATERVAIARHHDDRDHDDHDDHDDREDEEDDDE